MEGTFSRNSSIIADDPFYEPQALRYTSEYLRKLLIVYPFVYERIYNGAGSIVLRGSAASTETGQEYGTSIGSAIHNDIIEMGVVLKESFSVQDRKALYTWALGLSPHQSSIYLGVKGSVARKRRQRAVEKLAKVMNGSG